MDNENWRTGFPQDSRQKIVKRILCWCIIAEWILSERRMSRSDSTGELLGIARRFEEKNFQAATNQKDYLRKISLKMLTLETKAQTTPPSNVATLAESLDLAEDAGLKGRTQTTPSNNMATVGEGMERVQAV
ncbi:hypothetical protein R1sor_017288 [Riccia sorocarpa]|uniref:Mediator complex subunit 15 KIX domain-containing protein n=1 Tax=Riccia sorocarpa TaxID=122646 RepID=A0ABD3IAD8_9MARC